MESVDGHHSRPGCDREAIAQGGQDALKGVTIGELRNNHDEQSEHDGHENEQVPDNLHNTTQFVAICI